LIYVACSLAVHDVRTLCPLADMKQMEFVGKDKLDQNTVCRYRTSKVLFESKNVNLGAQV